MSAQAGTSPSAPRPSASILLVSPTNNVLLLHRVKHSSSFPSAHVFPGGNLSSTHDGSIPEVGYPERHQDGLVYRNGAIRECFEESGILLAKDSSGLLLEVDDKVREEGRKAVHENKITFPDWVKEHGGHIDTEGLIPFTRWVTPTMNPKRFTTQMYLYFLPLSLQNGQIHGVQKPNGEAVIPAPTDDGGLEHTEARFSPVQDWLAQATANEIILFPPQFFLMYLLAEFFKKDTVDNATLQQQRDAVRSFVHTGTPPWTNKCISPFRLLKLDVDGRQVLSLEKPGEELEGTDRQGYSDLVVAVNFRKEGPRDVEIMTRQHAFDEARRQKRAAQKGEKL